MEASGTRPRLDRIEQSPSNTGATAIRIDVPAFKKRHGAGPAPVHHAVAIGASKSKRPFTSPLGLPHTSQETSTASDLQHALRIRFDLGIQVWHTSPISSPP